MGAVTKLFVITLLAIVCVNGAYVKNFVPMDLKDYQEESTETTSATPVTHGASEEIKESKESEESNESNKKNRFNEEEQSNESNAIEDKTTERKKKSATTTFCVEIRPSDPYQKPFQVCEPSYPGYKAPTSHQQRPNYQPQPNYHHQAPVHHQPQFPYKQPNTPIQGQRPNYQPHLPVPGYNTPEKPPQTGYAAPPSYGQQPAPAGGNHQPVPEYQPPSVMVVPHVPVAEPYHVPQTQVRPGSGVYRTSGDLDGWDVEAEDNTDGNARTAYNSYETHEPYGHGKTIYKYEKDKKIDYIPVMVKTIKKTKPLKFLKVYKDIKKGKLKLYDDGYGGHGYGGHEYEEPSYGGHEYGGHEYGGHEYGGHGYGGHGYGHVSNYPHEADIGHHAGGANQHGLVITCQPSAVGYAGGETHAELQRHMDLLKNLYSASEKLFAEAPKTQVASGHPVYSVQPGYGVSGDVAHHTGVAPSVSSGSQGNYLPPSTYRNNENWDQSSQLRSSNNWEAKNQMNMNMNENTGNPMNIPSSAQPMMVSPTENVQKQLDTTATFRANRAQTNQGTT